MSASRPASAVYYARFPVEVYFPDRRPKRKLGRLTIDGRRLVVALKDDGEAVIVRLVSSNPRDYLDPRFKAGSRVRLPVW